MIWNILSVILEKLVVSIGFLVKDWLSKRIIKRLHIALSDKNVYQAEDILTGYKEELSNYCVAMLRYKLTNNYHTDVKLSGGRIKIYRNSIPLYTCDGVRKRKGGISSERILPDTIYLEGEDILKAYGGETIFSFYVIIPRISGKFVIFMDGYLKLKCGRLKFPYKLTPEEVVEVPPKPIVLTQL